MGSFTDYLENKLLDHVFKTASYTVPTNIYIALSTTTPTDAGANVTEPSGNNYSRTVMNSWDAASGGANQNTSAITFPTASGSWGTLTHFVIYDASSAGNALAWGALTVSKTVTSGDTLQFAAGAIDITLD